ncbi:gatm [Symbiodinium sp. CCMP2456]|nr:gatm [Symbiodinium sp. CCMP2456]
MESPADEAEALFGLMAGSSSIQASHNGPESRSSRREKSLNCTGRRWSHGWGIDGHPYLDTSSQFLHLSKPQPVAARAPAWAPSYPYPRALRGPGSALQEPTVEGTKREPGTGSLVEAMETAAAASSAPSALPEDLLHSLDDLSAALGSLDQPGVLAALQRLKTFRFEEEGLMASRAKDLLDAYTGRRSPPPPCQSWKLRAVEKEIYRRFREVCVKNPEGIQHFIESGLPAQLLSILEPYRLAKKAAEISAPLAKGPKPTPVTTTTATGASKAAASATYRAVVPARIGASEATLSSAALQLPWSSEECWERRWEQDLVWHPGILYAAHQALPQQR